MNFLSKSKICWVAIILTISAFACSLKPTPPENWENRFVVYKSLASDTGFAGYYVSFHDKKFLTFGQFLSTIRDKKEWREEGDIWVLTLERFDTDITDNGPIDMYFKEEKSPSGNINVLLFKVVTKDYEVPWVLLDQIVVKAGEMVKEF
ncbi:MAG: hypothetical protein O3A78_04790 [Nitrospinae bacterium]|nr:hypothetical protein [Nitrospinota bacterium]